MKTAKISAVLVILNIGIAYGQIPETNKSREKYQNIERKIREEISNASDPLHPALSRKEISMNDIERRMKIAHKQTEDKKITTIANHDDILKAYEDSGCTLVTKFASGIVISLPFVVDGITFFYSCENNLMIISKKIKTKTEKITRTLPESAQNSSIQDYPISIRYYKSQQGIEKTVISAQSNESIITIDYYAMAPSNTEKMTSSEKAKAMAKKAISLLKTTRNTDQ